MKIIVMARPDGTLFTRTPVEPQRKGETQAQYYDRLAAKNPKGATNVQVIEHTTLPKGHHHFKAARRWDGANVVVDMPAARAIKTGQIRRERDERLTVEDIAYMQADERNDAVLKSQIAARKQTLRDLPATIQPDLDAIATPQELETYEPTWPV